MRISSINVLMSPQKSQNKELHKNSSSLKYVSSSNFISNNSLSSVLGKSMISFGRATFDETIASNFFKLPEGAKPNEYQIQSAKSIYEGKDNLTTAPTGSGKTSIAYYAISKNMAEGKKSFYLAPLKALSGEKYRELQELFGKENVGLLTGDVKINTKAPILLMTTEIYNNIACGDRFKQGSKQLDNLGTVIYDEMHYLGHLTRGSAEELSIILSKKDTQLLFLSATVGNPDELAEWISSLRGKPCDLINVPPEKRPVPLKFSVINVQAKAKSGVQSKQKKVKITSTPSINSYISTVNRLKKEDKLPAMFVIFDKKTIKNLLEACKKSGQILNSEEEQKQIQEFIDKYEKEGVYLGESLDFEALKKGYAIHDAGLLPNQKAFIEKLSKKRLVKVVLATDTLSAGVNVPYRAVVLSSTRKPEGILSIHTVDGKMRISSNLFHQIGGRAGRQGLDPIGFFEGMATNKEQAKDFRALMEEPPNDIRSHLAPDYSFIAGYHKYTQDDSFIDEIFSKSLYAYKKGVGTVKEKQDELKQKFNHKRDVLKQHGFMSGNNQLTSKGELLSLLNGYEQIPIIDMIFDKKLANLDPKELAGCIAAFASTEEIMETDADGHSAKLQKEVPTELDNYSSTKVNTFVNEYEKYLAGYNAQMASEPAFFKVSLDKDVIKRSYAWANINEQGDDIIQNWKKIYSAASNKVDEGTLFREINRTKDLSKQILEIAKKGAEIATTETDRIYYFDLSSKLEEAVKIIAKNLHKL